MQQQNHLPDHCASSLYADKAYSFQNCIMPFLSRRFEKTDASIYVIEMMPAALSLRSEGRALRE